MNTGTTVAIELPALPIKPDRRSRMKRCECGCGQIVRLAPYNNTARGWVKGEPIRFIHGHHARKQEPEYVEEDRGFGTPCWIWQRAVVGKGYGLAYRTGAKRERLAHRVYYTEYVGPIPEGRVIHHRCCQRDCVNPDHLEATTQSENVRAVKGLTNETIRALVADRKEGVGIRELAEKYDIAQGYVSGLIRGAEAIEEVVA